MPRLVIPAQINPSPAFRCQSPRATSATSSRIQGFSTLSLPHPLPLPSFSSVILLHITPLLYNQGLSCHTSTWSAVEDRQVGTSPLPCSPSFSLPFAPCPARANDSSRRVFLTASFESPRLLSPRWSSPQSSVSLAWEPTVSSRRPRRLVGSPCPASPPHQLIHADWGGKLSQADLLSEAKRLRLAHWKIQKDAGVDVIPSNDFALYDQVLCHIQDFGVS